MTGIGITFGPDGPSFDRLMPVIDFKATVQNGLVNLGTRQGSDAIYPERGTRLMREAVSGQMVNEAWANHTASFAALHTLAFLQNTDEPDNANGMANLQLTTTKLGNQKITLEVGATSVLGQQIGLNATL